MNYYLDTDICIFALREKFPSIKLWMQKCSPEHIKISSIVKAELLLGALKSDDPKKVLSIVEKFLDPFEIISFDENSAGVYAQIRYDLEKKGQLIGPNDLLIASTVLAHQGTLITHNMDEFKRIGHLKIQDWCE